MDDFQALALELKDDYENGHKPALWSVIVLAATGQSIIPDWARDVIMNAHTAVREGNVRSWDDIFGSPLPPGTRQGSLRTKAHQREVYERVLALHRDEGLPIGDVLFARVGRDLGVGGKTT